MLAAGGSRRLGRPKQFVALGGTTLLERACRRALATRPAGVVVVVGAHASRAEARLARLPVVVVRNRSWGGGLSTSLRAGLGRIPAWAPTMLVTTADQWCVATRDLRRLARSRAPAAAAYDGVLGVPALLPRSWRASLRALRGDGGARRLLNGPGVRGVPMPTARFDLDTPADLVALRRPGARTTTGRSR